MHGMTKAEEFYAAQYKLAELERRHRQLTSAVETLKNAYDLHGSWIVTEAYNELNRQQQQILAVFGVGKVNDEPQSPNLLAKYDKQTAGLKDNAEKLFPGVYNEKYTLPTIVESLRKSYKERITHRDVLGEDFRINNDLSSGFCLITSYLIYSMTGGDKVWEIYGASPVHWWLVHKQTRRILDITYSQFEVDALIKLYQNGSKVSSIGDEKTMEQLKQKAHILAQRAGIE